MKNYQLHEGTKKKLKAELSFVPSDPTGAVPAWAFPARDADPSSWTNGEWDGAYNATTDKVAALSPIVGTTSSGATVELADGDFDVYIRFTLGSERPVEFVGQLVVG